MQLWLRLKSKRKKKHQREGIDAKKARGDWDNYGRPHVMSMEDFSREYQKVLSGELRPFELIMLLKMNKTTFYRYVKRLNVKNKQ